MSTFGARFAFSTWVRGIAALCCVLTGGCLVTSEVDLPEEIPTAPVVIDDDLQWPVGAVFRFNAAQSKELTINVHVRSEDIQETLKVRWRVKSGTKKPTVFKCPEDSLVPSGSVDRFPSITIESLSLEPGACNKVEFVVSSAFTSCTKFPEVFDATLDPNDIGRATYWVWEVSANPVMGWGDKIATTCETLDKTIPPTTMEMK